MSVLDQIKWSESDYGMKEFVEFFQRCLPILCQTTTGYAGCDEDIHQVAADEVYWIYDIQRQTRIVAKDKKGRYLSIPVDNCKYNFQIVNDNNKLCSMSTAAELLDKMQANQTEKICFIFENDQTVSYQIGADLGQTTKFGVIKLVESYEEKYLLGFGLQSEHLYSQTVGIPVYLDISFTRAVGFTDDDDRKGDKFQKWIKELQTLVDSMEKTTVMTCQEIILFPERPSNGDYEYIQPHVFLADSSKKLDKPETNDSEQSNAENEYSYIISRRGLVDTTTTTTTTNQVQPPTAHTSTGKPYRVRLPTVPRRRPPTPPPPSTASTCPVEETQLPTEEVDSSDGVPPPIPVRQTKTARRTGEKVQYEHPRKLAVKVDDRVESVRDDTVESSKNLYGNADSTREVYTQLVQQSDLKCAEEEADIYDDSTIVARNNSPNKCSREGQVENPPAASDIESVTSPSYSETSSDEVFTSSAPSTASSGDDRATGTLSRLAMYQSAMEVPREENAEDWTTGDVVEALRLLKMSTYTQLFLDRDVDGALLLNLDEKTLVQDFGFKHFEATKFFMFVRKGWRPK